MDTGKLTVFFEDPFWVGVFENVSDGKLTVGKVTFGREPRDFEVYELILRHYYRLPSGLPVEAEEKAPPKNPKRLQREARKQTKNSGIGTKSQQALKLQQEQGKQARKVFNRERREAEEQRKFEMKQQKKREKHRGR